MDIMNFFKDLVIGLAWPATVVFLAVYFRAECKKVFDVIAERLGKTAELKLPGGIKAIFSERREETAKRVADKVLHEIKTSINPGRQDSVKETIESVIYREETHMAVLVLIAAQGFISRQRLYSIATTLDPSLTITEVDASLKALMENELIKEESGRFFVTPRGVMISETKRLQGGN